MLRPFPRGGPGLPTRHRPGWNLPGGPSIPGPTPGQYPDDAPITVPTAPASQLCVAASPSSSPVGTWFQRPPGSPYGPGFGPNPPFAPGWGPPPAPSPQPPPASPGAWPPLAPGACPPPVPLLELAAAYTPFQAFTRIYAPGEMPAPGTIFPELLRTPPLYRWPPCTDGRV